MSCCQTLFWLSCTSCNVSCSVSDLGAALTAVMPEISVDGLTGVGMTWKATGEVSKAPKAVVIKDGAYVAM